MGIGETFKKMIGIEEIIDDDFDDEEIQEEKRKMQKEESKIVTPSPSKFGRESSRNDKVYQQIEKKLSFAGTNTFKLVVIEPKNFDECPKLVDSLKGKRPVIINLEKIETETAKKIFDFLSGATYALNGNVQKVANNIFIFAPETVDIASSQEDKGGFDFGENKNPWK